MHTIWLIARYEYGRHVRRRAFLWTVFGIPLLIAIVMGVVIAVAITTSNEERIGLVDQAGIVVSQASTSGSIPIERYSPEKDARARCVCRGAPRLPCPR
jgi:ABC-type Na+ efflux pump permease subunit